ncbi:MAG: DUF6443 domain-containing protein [Cyclobacteriaceae bacterium]
MRILLKSQKRTLPIGLLAGLLCLAFSGTVAQIVGPTAVTPGVNIDYTYDDGIVNPIPRWTIVNGTVITSSSSGTTYTCTVQWTAVGAGTLNFQNKNTVISTLNVTVCSALGTPTFASTSLCKKGSITATPGAGGNSALWYDFLGGTLLATGTTSPFVAFTNTSFYVATYNTTTGCQSAGVTVTVTLNPEPFSPTFSSTLFCGVGPFTLTAGVGTNGTTVRWYDADLPGGTLLATSTTSPSTTTTTTYYVTSYNATTTCETKTRSSVTLTIGGLPTAPTASSTTICGTSGSMTATPGTNANTVRWYDAATGGNLVTTGTTSPTVSTTTTYYLTSYNTTSGCESTAARLPVTLSIDPIPSQSPSATSTQFCGAGPFTITATIPTGKVRWYAVPTGGTPLSTNFVSPPTTTTTTYYMAGYIVSGSICETTPRVPVTLTVGAVPSAPTFGNTALCQKGSITATPGAGGNSALWYDFQDGTLLATSTTSPFVTLTNTSFYVTTFNTTTGCQSTGVTVTVIINPEPGFPVVSSTTFCGSGPFTLNAGVGTSGTTVRWYDANLPGGTLLATSTTSPSTTTTTTYYVTSYNATTTCETKTRMAVTLSIGALPAAPTASNTSVCGASGSMTALPGANANSVRWYDTATGGNLLTTNTSSPITSATTTYYLTSYNTTSGCESPAARLPVTLFIYSALPTSPIATSISLCGTGILKATPGSNANSVNWYNTPTGGTPLTTGIKSPATSITTTYYIASYNTTTGCESTDARLPVTLTMYPTPVVSANGPTIFSYGSTSDATVTLSTSTFDSYQWKRDDVNVSGQTLSSLTTSVAGNYTVATKVSPSAIECASAPISVGTTLINQPAPINYVSSTRIMKEGVNMATSLFSLAQKDLMQTVAYQDGMGRTFQTVAIGQSATQTDLVSPVAYGRQGLVDSTFLPYATATRDGRLRLNSIRGGATFQYALSEQKLFYQNTALVATDANPYARSVHRAAPDARVIEQGAPGTDWQPGTTHTVRNTSTINTATYPVRYWKIDGTTAGNYPANTVMVNVTTDENGNQVRTFNNKQGQTVLKQVQLDEVISGSTVNWLQTYYIYDEFGRLKYQVPPKAVALMGATVAYNVASNATTDKLVYKYLYDSLGRVVEKIEPGAAVKYIVYDKLGRVALTQDGLLRASNQWMYTKYDQYNRPAYSGIYKNTTQISRKAVQGLLIAIDYSTQPYFESPTNVNATTYKGYTNAAFPTANVTTPASNISVLAASYYDGYDFDQNGTADFVYDNAHLAGLPTAANTNTRNLPTGSGKLVVGTSSWLKSAIFYDQYDRTLQTQSNNHLNLTGIDKTSVLYLDLAGHVDKTKTTHAGPASTTVAVQQRYTYDPNWRTLGIFHSINGATEQQLAAYSYNILGQVVDKKLHVNGASYLQSVDMRYNIRGWLKTINNAQLTNDGVTNDDTNDYFGVELSYQTAEASALGNTLYFNGNVSAAKWKGPGLASGSADQRSYKYIYDKSDKLKSAAFQANTGAAWTKEVNTLNETMTYDHNGNMMTLLRTQNDRGLSGTTVTSSPLTIDQLTYSYTANSNQMLKVEDAVATTIGVGDFKNGSTAATEYNYTTDGSMNKDLNKGISGITYNVLGKPQVVTYSGTPAKTVTYTYDAAGTKLKTVTLANSITTTTDYIGGFVYTNNALSFFSSPEGRVVKNGSSYEYQYAIADHQGNTRVLFSSATPTPTTLTATFEGDANDNSNLYSNVNASFVVPYGSANNTPAGVKVVRMNQTYSTGPAKSMKVYPGDKVDMETYAYYESASGYGSSNNTVTAMVTSIASAFGGVSGGAGESGSIFSGINSALTNVGLGPNQGDGVPSAYLNYILFDQQYKVVDMGWTAVPATANFAKQKISIPQITVKEAGYMFVYLSYETASNNWVYFDDFKVVQTKTNVLQYSEYYPFGLQTANSWTRENTTTNNFLYNGGTELNTTTGVMDLFYRNYDPALGRMNQVDPMASKYAGITPYNYSMNSPVVLNDPMGDDSITGGKAYCSWCYFKDRPIDGGTAGGGGSGGGGSGGGITRDGNTYTIDFGKIGPYGGTWNNESGYHDFANGEQALAYGMAYNDYHNSWANTQFGSREATTYAYIWAKVTGQMPLPVTVNYHMNLMKQMSLPNFTASINGGPGNGLYRWDWGYRADQVIFMFFRWISGASPDKTFNNDRIATAMMNAPGIVEAREKFYMIGKKSGESDFGLKGLISAGSNPVQQFVGSFHYQIDVAGDNLQFTISNTTSFGSFLYNAWPYSWNWNSGPMGNYNQTYIFTEPLRKTGL